MQDRFACQIVEGKSQTEAYREAYPKSQKWKEDAVWSAASRLMTNSKVSARIAELRKTLVDRTIITAERVLEEIGKIAFNDIRKLKVNDTEVPDVIQTKDKLKALELAGKHLGLFKENQGAEEMLMPTRLIVEVVDGRKPALPAE